jgi:glycosyltransferase involved in cell wall biosynthesis
LLLATAHATPIVAAGLPTNRALVGDHGARWFTPGNSASLTLAIENALDDPDGGRARVLVAQQHARRSTWSDAARVTATAFRSAVARRSAPTSELHEPALHA